MREKASQWRVTGCWKKKSEDAPRNFAGVNKILDAMRETGLAICRMWLRVRIRIRIRIRIGSSIVWLAAGRIRVRSFKIHMQNYYRIHTRIRANQEINGVSTSAAKFNNLSNSYLDFGIQGVPQYN